MKKLHILSNETQFWNEVVEHYDSIAEAEYAADGGLPVTLQSEMISVNRTTLDKISSFSAASRD